MKTKKLVAFITIAIFISVAITFFYPQLKNKEGVRVSIYVNAHFIFYKDVDETKIIGIAITQWQSNLTYYIINDPKSNSYTLFISIPHFNFTIFNGSEKLADVHITYVKLSMFYEHETIFEKILEKPGTYIFEVKIK